MSVAVSAPGKVFFAGGFLVLDRRHNALVFGLDARIHVYCQDGPQDLIEVRSPQFDDAVWRYSYTTTEGSVHISPL